MQYASLNGRLRMNLKQALFGILAVSMLAVMVAACDDDSASEPVVEDAWARPGAEGDNSAAYMEITNEGDDDIVLTGASSDVARTVEIHESSMDDGMMHMEEIPEMVIEPGDTATLEPGGFHVMMMSLERDLEPEDTFDLTLHFDGLDDVELEVTVAEQ
jgi:periplasmic copper chaperone A